MLFKTNIKVAQETLCNACLSKQLPSKNWSHTLIKICVLWAVWITFHVFICFYMFLYVFICTAVQCTTLQQTPATLVLSSGEQIASLANMGNPASVANTDMENDK